jgi:hypothetical protein
VAEGLTDRTATTSGVGSEVLHHIWWRTSTFAAAGETA